MIAGTYREEVLNVLLALLLHERGIVSAPEQSFQDLVRMRRHVPDVLVLFQGLRTAIEGKVADLPAAGDDAIQAAKGRVEQGIAHIGLALVYPATLRTVPFDQLKDAIAQASLRIAICSEAGDSGWTEGDLNYLAELLKRTFDQLIQEDVVAVAVAALEAGIEKFSGAVIGMPGVIGRAAEILGIGEPDGDRETTEEVK